MLNYPVMYLVSERERISVNMLGIVFTLARLKIIVTIKKMLVDVFFSIVRCDAVENHICIRNSQLV